MLRVLTRAGCAAAAAAAAAAAGAGAKQRRHDIPSLTASGPSCDLKCALESELEHVTWEFASHLCLGVGGEACQEDHELKHPPVGHTGMQAVRSLFSRQGWSHTRVGGRMPVFSTLVKPGLRQWGDWGVPDWAVMDMAS